MFDSFVTFVRCSTLAVPCGTREDGLPASVTLIAKPGRDADLAVLAESIESRQPCDPATAEQAPPNSASPYSASPEPLCIPGEIALAVCGAPMSGLSLNHQLTDLGGRFMQATTTLPHYELYALSGAVPAKPGMLRVAKGGAAVPLEVWALPVKKLGEFMAQVKTPLSIGSVELADGSLVAGFLVEGYVTDRCEQIDAAEGWRGYLASKI